LYAGDRRPRRGVGTAVRILVFSWKDINHPWAGGSEVNIHEQARRWVQDGHQVTMFTTRFQGMKRHERTDGMDVYRAGGRFTIYLLAPFAYLFLLRHKADVILDIINGIPFFTPLYSRKPIVALVHHVHREMFVIELGSLLGRAGKLVEQYLVPLLYRRRPFICVSESTAASMRTNLYKGDSLDIRVIHNGISQNHYERPKITRFESPTVLYLGRLKKYKRLPKLIAMMPEVRERVPGAKLIVVGSGDARPDAEEAARIHGVDDCVSFLGFVSEEEKADLYRQSWVLATASMVEGWGLTVIEANACGTPAVSFNVPGLNESIVNGKTGRLATCDGDFVSALVEILQDESIRTSLSEGARDWSLGFNWDTTAARSLSVLAEALERAQGA
jgi:glycosyltransferase involved in cell wall biosynthesis